MFPYDDAVIAALRSEVRTVDDVLQVERALAAVLPDGDGLKWFNQIYLEVTEAVAARIAAPGGFTNPPWMALLDMEFAKLYFQAVEFHLTGRPAAGCWRALLDRRGNTAIARIQFALAGMNAHINHDLPVAIVTAFDAAGLSPATGSIQYADFTAVNSTLEALTGRARAELHVRLLGDALPPVTHLEDALAAWNLVAAREAAWTNAELLWDVREIPLVSGRYLAVLDGLAALASKALLAPVPL